MRVIDCDCGQTLKAGNDDDLVGAVKEHFEKEHPDRELDEDDARRLVENQAYQATDA